MIYSVYQRDLKADFISVRCVGIPYRAISVPLKEQLP